VRKVSILKRYFVRLSYSTAKCRQGIKAQAVHQAGYFVALPFARMDEVGLTPCEAVECPDGDAAVRRAYAMSLNGKHSGAVAFYRRGDPNIGEFEEAVILKTFGKVPDDFRGHP
jgi:hypothetical protein